MRKQLTVLMAALALSACTVTADVPNRVTIDADKVTIHRDDDHRHGHQQKYKHKHKKQQHCPYGQYKKGRC